MNIKFSKMKFYAILSIIFLLPFMAIAQTKNLPQLGKNSLKDVINAMTLEEKAHLVVGDARRRGSAPQAGPVIGQTQDKVPGAAGTTFPILRLSIPSIVVADGPAGLRISPDRKSTRLNSSHANI